ncbi:MAG TPA: hypothetical protein VGK51_11120 [Actinomycetota bacterium]
MTALALGLLLLTAGWALLSHPATAASTAPVCPNPPGSPCQAFFRVDKASGKVTSAIPLKGGNAEGQDYDGVECRGAGDGKCFLAADFAGFSLLKLDSFNCDSSTNETPIGTPPHVVVVGLAWDSDNNTLYTIDDAGQLYKITDTTPGSPTAGQMTAVGPGHLDITGKTIAAMAYDPATKKIYLSQDTGNPNAYKLTRVEPTTGAQDTTYGPVTLGKDTAGGVTRNEVLGLTFAGGTLYASISDVNDANPNLATIDPTTGAVTDIGPHGADYVGAITADAGGQIYAIAGTRGANITPLPCPSPTPTPTTPSPTPTSPTPTPTHSVTPSPSPSPSLSVGPARSSQTPSPGASVLGLSQTRARTLPVTGSNALPFVLVAAMCYLFGAVALKLASKRKGGTSE